jgi:hypothetical protein
MRERLGRRSLTTAIHNQKRNDIAKRETFNGLILQQ